jgi:hypothetical protein
VADPTVPRSLSEVSWFTRHMPRAACSVLLGRVRVYAGDWDGHLVAWDGDGDECWKADTEDRVEWMAGARDAIGPDGERAPFICATAGSDLVILDAATGEERWRFKLEGSADLVACRDDGSRVVATSSVYEIDYNDFIESTCWRFDADGELLRSDTFEERPWHLILDAGAVATLGLGRPRCGLIRQTDEDCQHLPYAPDDPILCGVTEGAQTMFGHASGNISALNPDGMELEVFPVGSDDSVLQMDCGPQHAVTGGGGAVLRGFEIREGRPHARWEVDVVGPVDELVLGFDLAGSVSVWVATWDGQSATIEVRSADDGSLFATLDPGFRVRSLAARDDRIAIGTDDGSVHLLRQELLVRRLEQEPTTSSSDSDEDASRRLEMQERLRALRG